jgi:hypothetical protein
MGAGAIAQRAALLGALWAAGAGGAAAQQWAGCFAGADATGAPARLALQAERYGDYFEIYGSVASPSIGVMQIKADGWSGAGRMFRNHEGEGGAVYIHILDYTGAGLVLRVEGWGDFPFRAVGC